MKLLAAAIAALSGAPIIDLESSIASTTAFAWPRFWAIRPATGWPFSPRGGVAAPPGGDTTGACRAGKPRVLTDVRETPAAAGAATTSAATRTAKGRRKRLT